jgi:hypothetical protein
MSAGDNVVEAVAVALADGFPVNEGHRNFVSDVLAAAEAAGFSVVKADAVERECVCGDLWDDGENTCRGCGRPAMRRRFVTPWESVEAEK